MQLGIDVDLRLTLFVLVLVGVGLGLSLLKATTQLSVFTLKRCGAFFCDTFAFIRGLDARMESARQAFGFRPGVVRVCLRSGLGRFGVGLGRLFRFCSGLRIASRESFGVGESFRLIAFRN